MNIGVRFGAEGIPDIARSMNQLTRDVERTAIKIESSFAGIGPSVQKATQNIERFKAGLKIDPTGQTSLLNTSENLINVGRSAQVAARGMDAFKNASSAGTGVITDVGRVIQDLPFGFLGIANNLQQLPGSFQRLSAAAKESGKSIGSLILSSVTGFGGIGLALSLVTGGLLIAQNGIAGFGRASRKAKEDAEELAKTIRDIGTIQAEATGGVQGQIAQVQSLANAVEDSNKPYAERKRALEELKDINKAYFGDLQLEDAATGKLTKTVEEFNKALIANAIVKSFADEITTVSTAVFKQEDAFKRAQTATAAARRELEKQQAVVLSLAKAGTTEGEIFRNAKLKEIDLSGKVRDALEAQRVVGEQLTDLDTQRALLMEKLNQATINSLKHKAAESKSTERENDILNEQLKMLEKIRDIRANLRPERSEEGILDLSKFRKDVDELAKVETEIGELRIKIAERDANKSKLPADQIRAIVDGIKKDTQDKLNAIFQQEAILLESIPKIKFSRVEIAPLETGNIESEVAKATGFDKKIPEMTLRDARIKILGLEFVLAEEEANRSVERLRETILNGVVDVAASTASSFGELISGIFSGQGIGNAFAKAAETLLSGIGGVLQEIGKQIIATSTLIKALKETLEKLITNPIAGIGIGLALVALGGALKSIKIPGFADGVQNFSGGLALVGERGPELVNLPRGSDVIPNHMLGGGAQTVNVVVEGRISGRDLVIIGQRQLQSNKTVGGGSL